MMSQEEITCKKNTEENRFEFELEDGKVGTLEFERPYGSKIRLTSTEVPKDIRGQGFGKKMVRMALKDADKNGLKVEAECPFVDYFIDTHPKWNYLRN